MKNSINLSLLLGVAVDIFACDPSAEKFIEEKFPQWDRYILISFGAILIAMVFLLKF